MNKNDEDKLMREIAAEASAPMLILPIVCFGILFMLLLINGLEKLFY